METKDFHVTESALSPEKEAMYLHKIENLECEVTDLREQLEWYKKQVFGRKTEKTEAIIEGGEQLHIFNEAETTADTDPRQLTTTVAEHKRKSKRTHDELMAELPVEEVIHEADRECPECGSEMKVIGHEKIRDELVYVKARMYVRRHMAEVVKCVSCGSEESDAANEADISKSVIIRGKSDEAFIPHSFCSPELLSHIIYEKYINAVPLYRLERDFKAMGAILSRTTMANWVIYAAEKYFRPIWDKMREELLTSDVIHADETVVQVLNEPGKKATSESRMWCYANGKINDKSIILFDYARTRNGDNANRMLGDYDGYLVCDGYDAYNKLRSAKRCGCLAHVRRKFVDALPKDMELITTSAAAKGVEYCNRIFDFERKYETLSCEERYKGRLEGTKPVLDEFFAWLETLNVTGKGNIARAVNYAINEKRYLYRFLEYGNVPVSNNRVENAIRPFCVGRKNWLFSASVKGAESSGIIYSICSSACANGLNVEDYITEVFRSGELKLPW